MAHLTSISRSIIFLGRELVYYRQIFASLCLLERFVDLFFPHSFCCSLSFPTCWDGERCVTPARVAANETNTTTGSNRMNRHVECCKADRTS